MRLATYAVSAFAASALVAWTAVHTDEETFTLALILLLSVVLGLAFPRRAAPTIALLGLPVCIMETFANYGLVQASYPTYPGVSWPALVALVPAASGTLAGRMLRPA